MISLHPRWLELRSLSEVPGTSGISVQLILVPPCLDVDLQQLFSSRLCRILSCTSTVEYLANGRKWLLCRFMSLFLCVSLSFLKLFPVRLLLSVGALFPYVIVWNTPSVKTWIWSTPQVFPFSNSILSYTVSCPVT